MWKFLCHPNIVPFFGISDIEPLALVSQYMPNGTVVRFLKPRPDENRSSYVCFSYLIIAHFSLTPSIYQLMDIVNGLIYLHSLNIIHGDIKGVSTVLNSSLHVS
jgi:serine/threonine protein kinase